MTDNAYYYSKLDKSTGYPRLIDIAFEAAEDGNLDKKIARAENIISIMLKLIEGFKGLPVRQEDHFQKWSEILITAAYLYSVFYEESLPFSSLMKPREVCGEAAKSFIVPGELEFIFQAVEACGGCIGIQKLKPSPDTPHEMLVLAVWLEKNREELFGNMLR